MGMFIISTLMILALIFPFFIASIIKKNDQNKIQKIVNREILHYGLEIKEKELWRNNFIGIDPTKKKLLYIKADNPKYILELIELTDLIECRIVSQVKRNKNHNTYEETLERLGLELTRIHPNDPISFLGFYSSEETALESYEIPRAEKWNKLINKYIPLKTGYKKAS
ncbi:MAG: hypothetical protein R2821_10380 [Flavobacteriaceae bacterium]